MVTGTGGGGGGVWSEQATRSSTPGTHVREIQELKGMIILVVDPTGQSPAPAVASCPPVRRGSPNREPAVRVRYSTPAEQAPAGRGHRRERFELKANPGPSQLPRGIGPAQPHWTGLRWPIGRAS